MTMNTDAALIFRYPQGVSQAGGAKQVPKAAGGQAGHDQKDFGRQKRNPGYISPLQN